MCVCWVCVFVSSLNFVVHLAMIYGYIYVYILHCVYIKFHWLAFLRIFVLWLYLCGCMYAECIDLTSFTLKVLLAQANTYSWYTDTLATTTTMTVAVAAQTTDFAHSINWFIAKQFIFLIFPRLVSSIWCQSTGFWHGDCGGGTGGKWQCREYGTHKQRPKNEWDGNRRKERERARVFQEYIKFYVVLNNRWHCCRLFLPMAYRLAT